MIGTPFHQRYCDTAKRGCLHMLAQTVEAARELAAEANMAIGLMNRREGPGVHIKLSVRERRTTPELHWLRLNKTLVTLDDGRKVRMTQYLKGLHRCTYDRRSFNFVPVAYRPVILGFEDRAVVIRRQIVALADLARSIDIVANVEPIIEVARDRPAGLVQYGPVEPSLAELME